MASELPKDDPRREYLEEVRRAGERAAALTRQLLAFSRKQAMQPRVLEPVAVLRGMEPMLRRLISEQIELVFELPPSVGRIKADHSHLEQAIVNLVVNARDAMPTGGRLTIEAAEVEVDAKHRSEPIELAPGPHARITVSDTGVGMDEATRARVFEPFFTTKGPGRGTGLGLSTVFGIVKQSGGAITVRSQPGHGTTFQMFFPRTSEPRTSEAGGRPLLRQTPGGQTILLVEDEPQLRRLLASILRRSKYEVLETPDPREALAMADAHPGEIHLLLTDVVMPHMNGKQLADRLAVRRPKTRVLYMSGYTQDIIVHHGVVDESVSFLAKPVTPDTLLAKVEAVLKA